MQGEGGRNVHIKVYSESEYTIYEGTIPTTPSNMKYKDDLLCALFHSLWWGEGSSHNLERFSQTEIGKLQTRVHRQPPPDMRPLHVVSTINCMHHRKSKRRSSTQISSLTLFYTPRG
jgi:hypothetical protein